MTRQQQRAKRGRNKNRPPAASRAAEPPRSCAPPQPLKEEEHHVEGSDVLYTLMEAFDSISLHEAEEAYKEADGDVNRAAEILANLSDVVADDDPSTSSVSSGGFSFSDSGNGNGSSSSSSGSSLTSESSGSAEGLHKGGNKQKKVVALAGTVSTVLGKDYVKAASPRRDLVRGTVMKGFGHGGSMAVKEEEAEEFLFSMLGDDCELNMGVVRDVLCQCGFDIEKALEILLGLSASSDEQSEHSRSFNNATDYREEDTTRLSDHGNLADCASDCTSHSSECDDNFWGYACRDYLNAVTGLESTCATGPRSNQSDIPRKVLESLFNIPVSSEHEPSTMNWKNVVKKMQSLGPGVGVFQSNDAISHQNSYAKGDGYHLLRGPAKEQWDTLNSYFRKAATAYSNGNREYAAYLSDQGRRKTKVAEAADLRASQNIFEARNKNIENVVTIDLHGQHVKPAMKLLKLHLLFGTYVRSIQTLRVITGCGSHSRVGKSKLKQSVVKLLVDEGVEWREENQGVVLIKLDGSKQYSFMDADSDDDL